MHSDHVASHRFGIFALNPHSTIFYLRQVRVLSRGHSEIRPEQLQQLDAFADRCVEVKLQEAENEAELGDVPDEFVDPITAELMEDPVKLPSGHSIDRAVISRHLLSDETDPFSRARCTVEMLVDNHELKAKIQAWKAERKAKRHARIASSSVEGANDAMPMEEG